MADRETDPEIDADLAQLRMLLSVKGDDFTYGDLGGAYVCGGKVTTHPERAERWAADRSKPLVYGPFRTVPIAEKVYEVLSGGDDG